MSDIAAEPSPRADAVHEHGWLTESSHQTSEGRVVYVRCVRCGVRRVDLEPDPLLPPRSLTRELGDRGASLRPEQELPRCAANRTRALRSA